jgi:hypothetical protein
MDKKSGSGIQDKHPGPATTLEKSTGILKAFTSFVTYCEIPTGRGFPSYLTANVTRIRIPNFIYLKNII